MWIKIFQWQQNSHAINIYKYYEENCMLKWIGKQSWDIHENLQTSNQTLSYICLHRGGLHRRHYLASPLMYTSCLKWEIMFCKVSKLLSKKLKYSTCCWRCIFLMLFFFFLIIKAIIYQLVLLFFKLKTSWEKWSFFCDW